ncbi:MAG TPA: hypothetical protein VMF06_23250 [Candidatus Limnocylindria bacterium]|jgi:hypothetical protein|nr:hypothetical protein [Candidatus Limnocylindria bacterium]
MIPEDREQLHLGILRWLIKKSGRQGLPASYLLAAAKSEAWPDLTVDELHGELEYLADPSNGYARGLIVCSLKMSPAASYWKLTAGGKDWAIDRNLHL